MESLVAEIYGWNSDPWRIHQWRYFSNGQPTKLVRDGSVESYDEPPPLAVGTVEQVGGPYLPPSPSATPGSGQWGQVRPEGYVLRGLPPQAYPPPPDGYPGPGIPFDPVLKVQLAPWWKRFVAILIDGVVLDVVAFIILRVIPLPKSSTQTPTTPNAHFPLVEALAILAGVWLVAALPFAVYYGAMNGSKRGQTLGKMALGIAVRDSRTGGPIGFWRAAGRFLIMVVFQILFFIPYVIDNLAPLWDARNQAWHDKTAQSVVIDL
jgi:uncharacterized RDD family membrane protein YckC